MVAILAYTIYSAKRRSGTHWNKWGPSYFVGLAAIFIMMDPARHLFSDQGFLGDWASEYKNDNCNSETVECLSATGWLVTIGATYFGYLLLMIGSFWNAQLLTKLKALKVRWRALRGNKSNNNNISSSKNVDAPLMEVKVQNSTSK